MEPVTAIINRVENAVKLYKSIDNAEVEPSAIALLKHGIEKLSLNVYAVKHLIKIAECIMVLDGVSKLTASHIAEAMIYFSPVDND
jgi:predicted ATPase with chaperone activity